MVNRMSPGTTVELNNAMPPPYWALLERELMGSITSACKEFFEHYFDSRGYQLCYPRWSSAGPDDAAENLTGLTDMYALGGDDILLEMYKQGFEGHLRQYSEARTVETPLGRDGMYYKEFPTSFDWVHNGEGFHVLFQQGLCEPDDSIYQARIRRFAGFYMNEDPKAPNYDPEHRIIRSFFTGSRGPLLRGADAVDWVGDPIEIEGRFKPGHGETCYREMVDHFSFHGDVVGDHPLNMGATTLALRASR